MTLSVLHNQAGDILAISQPVKPQTFGSKVVQYTMIAGQGQILSELAVPADGEGLSLTQIHNLYRVDPATSQLVKK